MADIHDLEEERDRREVAKFLKDAKDFKGFDVDFNLCGTPVHFTGHVMGGDDLEKDRLRLIIYDTSGQYVRPIGAIRIERDQWEKFKIAGDQLLDAHAKYSALAQS